jgi:hypothetical protein
MSGAEREISPLIREECCGGVREITAAARELTLETQFLKVGYT